MGDSGLDALLNRKKEKEQAAAMRQRMRQARERGGVRRIAEYSGMKIFKRIKV